MLVEAEKIEFTQAGPYQTKEQLKCDVVRKLHAIWLCWDTYCVWRSSDGGDIVGLVEQIGGWTSGWEGQVFQGQVFKSFVSHGKVLDFYIVRYVY